MDKPISGAWEEFDRLSIPAGTSPTIRRYLKLAFVGGALAHSLSTTSHPCIGAMEQGEFLALVEEAERDLQEMMLHVIQRNRQAVSRPS